MSNVGVIVQTQWRIQGSPDSECQPQEGMPTYYFAQCSPKIAWEWMKICPGGGGDIPCARLNRPFLLTCVSKLGKIGIPTTKLEYG